MQRIYEFLQTRQDEMLALLERLVNIDSGSFCKEGIDLCGRIIADKLRELGFAITIIPETDWGNHIQAVRAGQGGRQLLLSAHLDTVCPAGTALQRPFRVDGELAYGPGVGDMKGGIVQLLYALEALQLLGLKTPPLALFFTGDEEVGSIRGRPYIEALARQSARAVIMEPASTPASVGVRRWGLGSFYLTIHGKAAHVLKPEADGVNACLELALKILALESLSDTRRGIKVAVNLVRGGRSRQVTAAEANAAIDVRVRDATRMAEVEAAVRQVAGTPILPGIRIELSGQLTRPPLEPNPDTDAFLDLAQAVARLTGMELTPSEEYGGSDGCFTAALGVATLDAMGPLCYDMCGDDERIVLASLTPRTALLAGIIARLAGEDLHACRWPD